MTRRDKAEKMEITHLAVYSNLSVKRTWEELNVPCSTFYRWNQKYKREGETGLIEQRPIPRQILNHNPIQV
jgi:putative transposase